MWCSPGVEQPLGDPLGRVGVLGEDDGLLDVARVDAVRRRGNRR